MIKKKVLLYTGNHNPEGILDYVQTLNRMSNEMGFILHIKNNINHGWLHHYHSIIFIEQFFSLDRIAVTLKALNSFKGKKILILTEFFHKSQNTLNNFENIFIKKVNFLIEIFYKFIDFLIFSKTFKIFYILLKIFVNVCKLLKSFFDFFYGILSKITRLIRALFFLSVFQNKSNLHILVRKYNIFNYKLQEKIKLNLISKFKNYLKNKYNISPSQCYDYILMKKRYSSLMLFLNRFDFILKSHDQIKFKNYKMNKLYFYLDTNNDQIRFDHSKKIKLDFSGFLTEDRKKVLQNLCKHKNKFFDYSNIEEIARSRFNSFIRSGKNLTNVCSIHLKKTRNWRYSSPTRYVNSISKNEIPLIIDDFNDLESNLLTVNSNFLNCKNIKEVDKLINKLNLGIKKYARIGLVNNKNYFTSLKLTGL
jgi:hypothetical protein